MEGGEYVCAKKYRLDIVSYFVYLMYGLFTMNTFSPTYNEYIFTYNAVTSYIKQIKTV